MPWVDKTCGCIRLAAIAVLGLLSACVSQQESTRTPTNSQVARPEKEPSHARSPVWDQEQSSVVAFHNGVHALVTISDCNPARAQAVFVAWPKSRHQKDRYDRELLMSVVREAGDRAGALCRGITGQAIESIDFVRIGDGEQQGDDLVSFQAVLNRYVFPALLAREERRYDERQTAARKREEAEQRGEEGKRRSERIARYRNRGWTDSTIRLVTNGTMRVGMTTDQAAAAWGQPCEISRSVRKDAVTQKWGYGESGGTCEGKPYLYFRDGLLERFEE